MSETKQVQVTNPWMLELLQIIFIVLKLNPGQHLDSPVENWSWGLVFIPMWGLAAFFFAVAILIFIGLGINKYIVEPIAAKRRRKKVWKRLQERDARRSNRLR